METTLLPRIHTHAELLLALFDEDELEEWYPANPQPKQPETAFCCMRPIDKYEPVCPHCGGDPYPF